MDQAKKQIYGKTPLCVGKDGFMEKCRITENGVAVYYYPNPAQSGFFVSLFVRAGSMTEPEELSGITHFLEHIAIRNLNQITNGELYRLLDSKGVEFNASTFAEMIQFYTSGALKNFEVGVDVITRLLSPINLRPSEIDVERKRIKAEIREGDDKNSLATLSNRAVHSGTSLERPITGTNSSVDRITLTRLEKYRAQVMSAENIFFYVTGGIGESEIDLLCRLIELYPVVKGEKQENIAPVPQKFCKRDGEIIVKEADYTSVRFTFDMDLSLVGIPETDLLYDILLSGYSSEFYMELSEKSGFIYDIQGSTERYRNIGTFYFSYEVKDRDLYDAVETTVAILKKYKSEAVSEQRCMKAGYVDNAGLLFDDAREFNFTMAYDNHIMELSYLSLDERTAAYLEVTPEMIRHAANVIFRPENLTVVVKGHRGRIDKDRIKKLVDFL